MPDITMCKSFNRMGQKCPIRDKCYRFTAVPNEIYQSYFQNAPFTGEGDPRKPYSYCGGFWGYDNFGRSTVKK